MTTPPRLDLTRLADLATNRGADPEGIRQDVLGFITRAILAHPRSRQVELGPSELGHPCQRWLAYRLAGTPETGRQRPPWRQAVGTKVHDGFTDWALDANEPLDQPRWLADLKVTVGELLPGRPITGRLDLLDLATATVVDLKVAGPNQMRLHSSGARGENEQYRKQVHLYGRGVVNAGLPVDNVAILRLPAAGELAENLWHCEPYDDQLATDALRRAGAVAALVAAVGADAAGVLPTTDHFCHRCPYFDPGSTNLAAGCPGDAGRAALQRPDPLTQLVGARTP
ncbi:MAG: hypothetical protein ACRDTD_12150 [Pseudonocardiaceae bacterium]